MDPTHALITRVRQVSALRAFVDPCEVELVYYEDADISGWKVRGRWDGEWHEVTAAGLGQALTRWLERWPHPHEVDGKQQSEG